MSDIVHRLRHANHEWIKGGHDALEDLAREAADEIDHLREFARFMDDKARLDASACVALWRTYDQKEGMARAVARALS